MSKNYVRPNEHVGGGFFVVQRSTKSSRVKLFSRFPFEHPDYNQAADEAKRLQELHPEKIFTILQEVPVF